MEEREIKNKIRALLKRIKGEYFEYEEELVTLHYISSFELVSLISELEQIFGIEIALEEVSPDCFDSISDICKLVEKLGD